ncbi:MAG: hypothetical protein R8J84_00630 [Mariprofundales bacterium]
METWIQIIVRQIILYLLPVLISLTLVQRIEQGLSDRKQHPFFAFSWSAAWLPLLASIAMTRAVIIALPQPITSGLTGAWRRLAAHGILMMVGFLLYSAALHWPPATGLPPLHHWWSKVLMYFNLCMVFMHLLPIPTMVMGEWLSRHDIHWYTRLHMLFQRWPNILLVLLVASPLLDFALGWLIFPPYEWLATQAALLAG